MILDLFGNGSIFKYAWVLIWTNKHCLKIELMGCYDGCVVRENIPYRPLSRRSPVFLTEMMIYCMSAPPFSLPIFCLPLLSCQRGNKAQKMHFKKYC